MIDNSVALAWVLPDETGLAADAVLERVTQLGAYVPFIFPAEFSNGLTMAVRCGRINKSERSVALDRISNALNIVHDLEGARRMSVTIELADLHDLTVYDAIYLELAQRMRFPLATFDTKMAAAAQQAGVSLVVTQ